MQPRPSQFLPEDRDFAGLVVTCNCQLMEGKGVHEG